MSHRVHHATDLAELMDAGRVWNDLAFAGSGPSTLEIRVAAGTYRGAALTLADTSPVWPVSLDIRGEPGVLFEDMALHLAGPRVSVQDLVFRGRRTDFVLDVTVEQEAVLSRLAFVDLHAGEAPHPGSGQAGGAIAIEARGSATRATLRDVWLVRSRHAGGLPLVQVRRGDGHLEELRLHRVAASGLGGGGLLGVNAASTAILDRCVVALDDDAAVVTTASTHLHLDVRGGAFALRGTDRFLRAVEGYERLAMEFLPARVTGARVLVRTDEDDADPGVMLLDCDVLDSAPRVDQEAWLRGATGLETPSAQALLR